MTEQTPCNLNSEQAVDDLEVELNKHAVEGYEWVEQIMVGHVAAIVLKEVRLSGTAATRCEPQTRLSIRRPVHCGRHQSLVVSICKRPRRGVLLGGVQGGRGF